ncbi:MAG TPA: hypothetical protein V6D11_31500 [Waterburya sp.]|jgi:hypothetical protein
MKFTVFFSRMLAMATLRAMLVLGVTLTPKVASTSTRLPTTWELTIRDGATVEPSVKIVRQPRLQHLQWLQSEVRTGESRTQRLQFKPGAVGTVVAGRIGRGNRDIYLLRARENQTMILELTSFEQNVVFDVQAPSGEYLKEEASSFRGELPQTGDYSVIVSSSKGYGSYRLEVTIR